MISENYESGQEELEEQNEQDDTIDIDIISNDKEKKDKRGLLHGRLKKVLLLSGVFTLILLLLTVWLIFTKSGRKVIYRIAGGVIYDGLNKEDDLISPVILPLDEQAYNTKKNEVNDLITQETRIDYEANLKIRVEPRSEDYVSNYLIFGIEEIENAKNTDTIMIASINTKDDTIKLTSLLRDTYIEMEGSHPNKLNSFFAIGGAKALVDVIEENYRIKIDGYACINFESFEKVIDYIGGIPIELGKEEAHYLNTTNYISNPSNRTVKAGMNVLNGNQALGYCRIRGVKTLGGATDDYGRTLRQRRVLSAIFNNYKSKGFLELLFLSNEILGYVKTDVSRSQIEKALEDIIENKITTMDTKRIPVNGAFEDPIEYNDISYPLVLDWDANIMELYQFIFLDTKEEAMVNLEKYR